jgi:glycine hydroxymethyltransferase
MTTSYPHDAEIERLIDQEAQRQRNTINLIAAENYASSEILRAQGSVLTNKYAEGYPTRRYYSGCINVNAIESLAIERAMQLFKADHANVQPHSGSQANFAAYLSTLTPGDTVMGMTLTHGGHLTHGSPANFSGKWFKFVSYGVNRDTELLDYDEIQRIASDCKPKLIVAGASAYPRVIDFERFRRIADSVGSILMVDMAHISGLIAAGLHPSPVPYADLVTSSTHKTLRGPRSGFILCRKERSSKVDSSVFPGAQGGPLMHVVAAKAICFFEALQPSFVTYQRAVLDNAKLLGDELKSSGFRLVSGGTDNHIILVDLTSTGLTGKAAEEALEACGIVINRNTIPFETRPPQFASGIRLGTPAMTTRGAGPNEIRKIAALISRVLSNIDDRHMRGEVGEEVKALCQKLPVPA